MKKSGKYLMIAASLIGALALSTGCSSNKITGTDTPDANVPSYSNLVDEASITQLSNMLKEASVSEEHINQLIGDINDYNTTVKGAGLVSSGYVALPKGEGDCYCAPTYSVDKITKAWTKKYPVYTGYNCRITAFESMRNLVTVEHPERSDATNLFMDESAINDENPSPDFSEDEITQFKGLYPTIQTVNSTDSKDHYAAIDASLKERGVTYTDNDCISQISVYFHSSFSETENEIIIGHTGILLPQDDGTYYFFEKLSFEEPYQLIHFQTKEQLADYLIVTYNVDTTGTSAAPIIYENDHLMER